jgi:Chaperone of endosialidase
MSNEAAMDPSPEAVDGAEVLEKLASLPISSWNYIGDDPSVRHLGPMAQDFAKAFGLGADERLISGIDAQGVAMVAIQALYRRVQQLESEIAELRQSSPE